MKPDEFEKRLADLPLRSPPASWRTEILAAARAQATTSSRVIVPPPTAPGQWLNRWSDWLWPCPQAWAGLAAAWIVIVALRVTPTESSPTFAGSEGSENSRPPERGPELSTQRQELVRLLENAPELSPAPKRNPPGPRSDLPLPPRA